MIASYHNDVIENGGSAAQQLAMLSKNVTACVGLNNGAAHLTKNIMAGQQPYFWFAESGIPW